MKVLDVFPGAEVREVRLREKAEVESAAAPLAPPDEEALLDSDLSPEEMPEEPRE
jgi:hypothetical protein